MTVTAALLDDHVYEDAAQQMCRPRPYRSAGVVLNVLLLLRFEKGELNI